MIVMIIQIITRMIRLVEKKKAANISGVLTMCQAWVERLTIGLILSRKPLFTQLLRTKTKLQGT